MKTLFFILIASIVTPALSKNPWRSPSEALNDELVRPESRVLEISLSVDHTKEKQIRLHSVRDLLGNVNGLKQDGNYKIELISNSAKAVHSFQISDQIFGAPGPKGNIKKENHEVKLKRQSIAINVPYLQDLVEIKIINESGETVAEFSRPEIIKFRREKPADFKSIRGSDLLKANGISVYAPSENKLDFSQWLKDLVSIPSAYASGKSPGTLHLVFVASGYGNNDVLFQKDVMRAAGAILFLQPYKARASSIIIHTLNPKTNLGCGFSDANISWLLTCNESQVRQAINSAGITFDYPLVLVNQTTYGGSASPGGVAVSYNGPKLEGVMAHEFMHQFPELYDEYNVFYHGHELFFYEEEAHISRNCASGGFPFKAWKGLVGEEDIMPGCVSGGFKPARNSLMSNHSAMFLNTIALKVADEALNRFIDPLVDVEPPTCKLLIEEGTVLASENNSGNVSFANYLQGTDNVGIHKFEVYWDGVYKISLHGDGNWYEQAVNLFRLTNGPHKLRIKARDHAGNVGDCGEVNVVVQNYPDTDHPKVDSVYFKAANGVVSSGTDLNGITKIRINGRDDQEVMEQKLKINGKVFSSNKAFLTTYSTNSSGTGIDRFFFNIFSFDTTQFPNGTYPIEIEVTDFNLKTGKYTSNITILNDYHPPQVRITSPTEGATAKGKLKVTCAASDDVKVKHVILYIDGFPFASSETAPFTIILNSNTLSAGMHTLQLKAVDTFGKEGWSQTINIKK